MYFGGCFYFILPNILWQKPKINLAADNLYLHEYEFIAFASDNAATNAFKSYAYGNFDISEFSLPKDNPYLNLELIQNLRLEAKKND
jgi:hypothetical protein